MRPRPRRGGCRSAGRRYLTWMADEGAGDDGRHGGQRPVDEVEFAEHLQGLVVKDPFRLFSVGGEGHPDAWPAGCAHGTGVTVTPGIRPAALNSAALTSGGAIDWRSRSPIVVNAS